VVVIRDGPEIRPPPKASKSAADGKKRKARWVIPKDDSKIQWKRLIEAVTVDYIQKGPDGPSPLAERRKVKKVPADDRAIKRLIKHRYEMIFKPVDGRRMTEIEIEGVMFYSSDETKRLLELRCAGKEAHRGEGWFQSSCEGSRDGHYEATNELSIRLEDTGGMSTSSYNKTLESYGVIGVKSNSHDSKSTTFACVRADRL
jgi:hypothetical protein